MQRLHREGSRDGGKATGTVPFPTRPGTRFPCTAGSEEERAVFAKAERGTSSLREEDEGLHLKIKLSEGANNGCDFDVFAVIRNGTDAERVCRLMLCARTASYSGTVGPQCGMKDLLNVTLAPRAGRTARRGGFGDGWGRVSAFPVFSCVSGVCGAAVGAEHTAQPSSSKRWARPVGARRGEPGPAGWAVGSRRPPQPCSGPGAGTNLPENTV